jgi:hypothetical protein
VAGFGENERAPSTPTTSIVIAPAGGALIVLGLVADDPAVSPHAATPTVTAAKAAAKQNLRMT